MDQMVVAIAIPEDQVIARSLLTHGRRLAGRLGARWVALRVHSQSIDPRRDDATRRLSRIVAMQGGELVCAASSDEAGALVAMTARERAAVLLIGPSRRFRLFRRWIPGMTEKLLRSAHPFDVVVANPERLHD